MKPIVKKMWTCSPNKALGENVTYLGWHVCLNKDLCSREACGGQRSKKCRPITIIIKEAK